MEAQSRNDASSVEFSGGYLFSFQQTECNATFRFE